MELAAKALLIETFMPDFKTRPPAVEEFDEKLWMVSMGRVMVEKDGRLMFFLTERMLAGMR